MAKVKLGNRPKSFKKTITFDMLEGGKGSIECIYKYRTKKEFGEFIDALRDSAGENQDASEPFSMAALMERTSGSNADYILDVLDGWNLDEDLTRANVQQLADELPAATIAIMETYRTACMEGRAGN